MDDKNWQEKLTKKVILNISLDNKNLYCGIY
jgi:hypothetical protein